MRILIQVISLNACSAYRSVYRRRRARRCAEPMADCDRGRDRRRRAARRQRCQKRFSVETTRLDMTRPRRRVGLRHGRAPRWDPPRHAPAADAAGARPLRTSCRATTAGRSSTPGSGCRTRASAGRPSSTGFPGRCARIVVTHFHPDHVGAAADLVELTGAPRRAGAARLRAVRPRLGRRRLGGRPRRLVPPPRRARRRDASS